MAHAMSLNPDLGWDALSLSRAAGAAEVVAATNPPLISSIWPQAWPFFSFDLIIWQNLVPSAIAYGPSLSLLSLLLFFFV